MRIAKRLGTVIGGLAMAATAALALPGNANAWVVWGGGVRVGIGVPGVVVAPPPVYYPPPRVYVAPPPVAYVPPPAYYGPPARVWIPPHWRGGYYVPGHGS